MADVAGFSRLMGRDEEGTTARILEFHDMVRGIVEDHGGRVVATAGDSVFGEFDSIVDALDCALTIQRGLHEVNADRDADDRIEARIGLHLGDVIVEERNVFGDGVNVAARLEQMADPGGIMLSEAAYHLVRGRTELPIQSIGAQTLKNIDTPIEVYRIPPDAFGGEAPSPPTETAPSAREQRREALREDTRERIRDAIARIAESAADRAERAADDDDLDDTVVTGIGEQPRLIAPIRAGTLTLLTMGVLGILARTSGWSDNGWYPFLGSTLLGIGVGGVTQRVSGVKGTAGLLLAIGIGTGALFFDNVVMRSVLWVITAAVLGGAMADMSRRRGSRR